MNKGRLILGIGLIVLAISIFVVSSSADIQVFGMGSGSNDKELIKTTDLVQGVKSVKADGVVDVHISMSDTESVRYEYDNNQFENKSTFEDGALRINFPSRKKGINLFNYSSSEVDVYISVKSLEHIEMNGIGSVNTDGLLQTDNIKIINEGTGSINLKIATNKMTARNSGVGSLKISGTADTATLSNQGVGSLNADKLVVQILNAKNDGVGSMKVYAEKEIKLRNSGVGSISYSGDAQVTSQRSEGVGSISKR